MFSFLKRKQRQNSCLGVGFHQNGISMALASRNRQNDIVLEHLEYRIVSDKETIPAQIKKMVSEAGFKGMPAVFVMDHAHYSLLQVEVPEVSQEELKNAVRWRIKDLIDFHIDDAVIDLIPLPQSKRAGSPKLMYVVAARSAYVQNTIQQLESSGLTIRSIDIAELALRNMTFADTEENRAGAILYLSENLSLIEICDNGSLCLSRQINMDMSRLDLNSEEKRMEVMDMLSLEVQRSLDYYESQFASGAASKLNIVSECLTSVDEFREVAGSYLTVPINKLTALDSIKGIEKFEGELVASCLPTIGGAIRDYVWTS